MDGKHHPSLLCIDSNGVTLQMEYASRHHVISFPVRLRFGTNRIVALAHEVQNGFPLTEGIHGLAHLPNPNPNPNPNPEPPTPSRDQYLVKAAKFVETVLKLSKWSKQSK